MLTVQEMISKAGGSRRSSATKNEILNSSVKLKHVLKGHEVTATAVGIEGERVDCAFVKDERGGMWRPAKEYSLID